MFFINFPDHMVGSQRDKGVADDRKRNKNKNRGQKRSKKKCKKQKYRDYFIEEHGCRSKRPYKMAKCVGPDGADPNLCAPTKIKTRKIRFVCPDGSNPRKTVEIIRKCGRKKDRVWG